MRLENSQNQNKKILFKRNEIITIAAFFAFVLGLLIFTFFSPNYYNSESTIELDIPKGETLTKVIDSLYSREIIPNKLNMKIASYLYGADRKIKAGRYSIPNGLSYIQLVELLINGSTTEQVLITIPEGICQNELAGLLEEKLMADSSKVMGLSSSKSFLNSLNINAKDLEGYLLPESYYFYPLSSEEDILRRLKSEMDKFFSPKLIERMNELKMTKREVLTLASIIDGESNSISEFKIISGVYHNRLKKGMLLQADPTVQYLIRNRKNKKIYLKDLEIDSKYNTYKYVGLPPGPINNPGKDAILAALYPDKNDYLYFVADGNGGHHFSKTFSEHSQNVMRYRIWQRKQN